MQSRKVTLANPLVLNSGRSNSVDLPMGAIINQIRIRVLGTYTGLDANLNTEFPYNIFRLIDLKASNGSHPYSIPSKDLRIMNYLDKSGKVTFSASGGNYEANFVLDRGELLALRQGELPSVIDHPSLPYGSLSLALTWAQDADCGTSIILATGTAEIEVEQTPVTKEDLQTIYGDKLERYQMPEIYVKGDTAITSNSKPSQAIILDVGKLKKRTINVLSDATASVVRSSAIATQLQLNNQKQGWERTPIDRTFKTIQNEDAEQYNLTTILAGVASIDYSEEIANNPHGFPSWQLGDKDLSIFTTNSANGNIRVIEESKIVNVSAFESGNIIGAVVGQFKPAHPAK